MGIFQFRVTFSKLVTEAIKAFFCLDAGLHLSKHYVMRVVVQSAYVKWSGRTKGVNCVFGDENSFVRGLRLIVGCDHRWCVLFVIRVEWTLTM